MPDAEDRLTIDSVSPIWSRQARQVMKLPVRLTSRIWRKISALVFSAGMSRAMPAQLTSPVTGPKASTAWDRHSATSSSSVTSQVSARMSSPARRSSIRETASAPASRMVTATPSSISASAVTSPMPDAPPVTTT
jgi:hypothetical protein